MSFTEDKRSLTLSVLKATQPIGDFYIGKIDSQTLCEITIFDIRHLVKENEMESYLGIQRRLDPRRVREISDYVRTTDACFPTAVILAVRGSCAEYNEATGQLTLSNLPNPEEGQEQVLFIEIARVLDGQHRIEGLRGLSDRKFEVNVCIFVELDIAEQAYIFATVNLAQTKVNPSLVYDLFDFAKLRSPQKVCHNIAIALDGTAKSPFYQKIKRLGVATEGRFGETLTQANFVQSLIPYLSKNPNQDREIYRQGKVPAKIGAKESESLIFRNMMIDSKDLEITDILWNYFDAVRSRWPEAWAYEGRGRMLNRTNGFRGLMRFLRNVYLRLAMPGKTPYKVPSTDEFGKTFGKIDCRDDFFSVENFKPGTGGEAALYRFLKERSGLDAADPD
jgi:DGQHR domain-containing protein